MSGKLLRLRGEGSAKHDESLIEVEEDDRSDATVDGPAEAAAKLQAAVREEAAAVRAQAHLQVERAKRLVADASSLTSRQQQVLALVALGYTSTEISVRLRLTVRSVESHRAAAVQRLGVTSMPEIVSWALHNGHVLVEGETWDDERFLATVREAPLAVLVADAEMRFSDASDAACRDLGYSHEELLQLAVPDIVLDAREAERRYGDYLMAGAQHGTITLRRKGGSSFDMSYTATVRHVGEAAFYVSVLVPE